MIKIFLNNINKEKNRQTIVNCGILKKFKKLIKTNKIHIKFINTVSIMINYIEEYISNQIKKQMKEKNI